MTHKRLPDTRLSQISQTLFDSNKSCGILPTHFTLFSIWITGSTGSAFKDPEYLQTRRDSSAAFRDLRDSPSWGQCHCTSTAAEGSNEAWQETSERAQESLQNPVTPMYYKTARRQRDSLRVSLLLGQQHHPPARSAGTERNELFCSVP